MVLLSPAPADAQAPPAPAHRRGYSPYQPGSLIPGPDYARTGWEFKRIGIPLTLAGAVSLPVGIILASAGAGCSYSESCSYGTYAALSSLGSLSIVGGVAALGAGIPLWAIGDYRLRRAGMPEATLSVLPGFGVDPRGRPSANLMWTLTF